MRHLKESNVFLDGRFTEYQKLKDYKEGENFIKINFEIFSSIFDLVFTTEEIKTNKKKANVHFINNLWNIFNIKSFKEPLIIQIQSLINYFKYLNSLNHTKNFNQIYYWFFILKMLKTKFGKYIFDNYDSIFIFDNMCDENLSEKCSWCFFIESRKSWRMESFNGKKYKKEN